MPQIKSTPIYFDGNKQFSYNVATDSFSVTMPTENVYRHIFKEYGVQDITAEQCISLACDIVAMRMDFLFPDPNTVVRSPLRINRDFTQQEINNALKLFQSSSNEIYSFPDVEFPATTYQSVTDAQKRVADKFGVTLNRMYNNIPVLLKNPEEVWPTAADCSDPRRDIGMEYIKQLFHEQTADKRYKVIPLFEFERMIRIGKGQEGFDAWLPTLPAEQHQAAKDWWEQFKLTVDKYILPSFKLKTEVGFISNSPDNGSLLDEMKYGKGNVMKYDPANFNIEEYADHFKKQKEINAARSKGSATETKDPATSSDIREFKGYMYHLGKLYSLNRNDADNSESAAESEKPTT